jgi:hypothetical protein
VCNRGGQRQPWRACCRYTSSLPCAEHPPQVCCATAPAHCFFSRFALPQRATELPWPGFRLQSCSTPCALTQGLWRSLSQITAAEQGCWRAREPWSAMQGGRKGMCLLADQKGPRAAAGSLICDLAALLAACACLHLDPWYFALRTACIAHGVRSHRNSRTLSLPDQIQELCVRFTLRLLHLHTHTHTHTHTHLGNSKVNRTAGTIEPRRLLLRYFSRSSDYCSSTALLILLP